MPAADTSKSRSSGRSSTTGTAAVKGGQRSKSKSKVKVTPKSDDGVTTAETNPDSAGAEPAGARTITQRATRLATGGHVGSQGLRLVTKRRKAPLTAAGQKAKEQAKVKAKAKRLEEQNEGGDNGSDSDDDDDWDVETKKAVRWWGFLVVTLLYFGVGIAYYCGSKGWDVLDTVYFAVVVLTTVGYGDHTSIADDDNAMLFTAFYVVAGVGIIAVVASAVIAKLVEMQAELAKIAQAEVLEAMLDSDEQAENKLRAKKAEDKKMRAKLNKMFGNVKAVLGLVGVLFIYGMGFMVMMLEEDLTFVQTFYWMCVTGTTVGFGDYSFKTDTGKGFACVWLLCVTFTTAALLSKASQFILGNDDLEEMLDDELTANMISDLDGDGDGMVTREEYICSMLIRLDYVDAETIQQIADRFEELDADGSGVLNATDLIKSAPKAPPGTTFN